ncbi:hypothetical protein Q8F55_004789 [Vanrija albida]|uniref:Extracellular membrane protein CFEM domain-containing protein n=1 Tax=Vanrija albida TaxID=181172 RepID=A0ABR3Q0L9_9TREE
MKFAATLAVIAAFALGANAQAVDPDTVSKDILNCLIASEKSVGCPNPVDFACICSGPQAGAFLADVSNCPAVKADLINSLNLKNRLCSDGLVPLPSTNGPVDATKTAADYPDAYKCVLDAIGSVGCADLATAKDCVCSTKQGDFLYSVAPCFLGTSVKVSIGLGLASDLCKFGVTNLPGGASSSAPPASTSDGATTGGPASTSGGATTGGPASTSGGATSGGATTGGPASTSGGTAPTCRPKPAAKRRRIAGAL